MNARFVDRFASLVARLVVMLSLLFLVAPLLLTTLMSFDARSFVGAFPPPSLSLHWYRNFFEDDAYLAGLRTSLALAAITTLIATGIGLCCATLLSRWDSRFKDVVIGFMLSPLVIPPVVVGFALLLYLSRQGVPSGFASLLCGHLVITTPYAVRACVMSVASVDRVYSDAAASLGARGAVNFFTVALPLARGGVVAGAIFCFAVSMDDFAVSIFLSNAHSFTLPVALVVAMRANFDMTVAAASVLFVVLTLVLMFILEKTTGFFNAFAEQTGRSRAS
jgi:putative spermidine/putrescine transport system permease protein